MKSAPLPPRPPMSGEKPRSAPPKACVLSIRIRPELKARLEQPRIGPYRLSITDIVERGIELALKEIDGFENGR